MATKIDFKIQHQSVEHGALKRTGCKGVGIADV